MNKLTITKSKLSTFQVTVGHDSETSQIFRTDNLNQLLGYVAAKLEDAEVM